MESRGFERPKLGQLKKIKNFLSPRRPEIHATFMFKWSGDVAIPYMII